MLLCTHHKVFMGCSHENVLQEYLGTTEDQKIQVYHIQQRVMYLLLSSIWNVPVWLIINEIANI